MKLTIEQKPLLDALNAVNSLFHDLVRSFSGEHVELELVKDVLQVVCGRSNYSLPEEPGVCCERDDWSEPAKEICSGLIASQQSEQKKEGN